MKDFKLVDNTNNLELVSFDFAFTENLSEFVADKLRIKLSFFKGEWYLNTNAGIPYFQSILKKNPDLNLIEDVYKEAILSVDGVSELIRFELLVENSTRELFVNFVARLTDGSDLELTV